MCIYILPCVSYCSAIDFLQRSINFRSLILIVLVENYSNTCSIVQALFGAHSVILLQTGCARSWQCPINFVTKENACNPDVTQENTKDVLAKISLLTLSLKRDQMLCAPNCDCLGPFKSMPAPHPPHRRRNL